jgi:ABC-2 type transport system ATP-binding protein
MGAPAIQIEGVTKDFSVGFRGLKLRAVDDLSLEIGTNEIFGLLGPNGSGKSTTIKIVLGLVKASKGMCRIFGLPSQSVSARRSVGYLPEAPSLYPYLTGSELVAYYARLCGVLPADLSTRVESTIELVDMKGASHRRVGTYSKGMLQRIGLAQALVHDPQLVVLDEPTAGVDPMGTAVIAEIIRELKSRGKTILICSHLLAQIEDLCDRLAILHRGQLIRSGRVSSLLQDSNTQSFVVEQLSPQGRLAVEKTIREQGATLCRVERPRQSLDSLFINEVDVCESTHQNQ